MRQFFLPLLLSTAIASAQNGDKGNGEIQQPPVPADLIPPAPFLSPEDSIKTMEVTEGFQIETVAAEDMVDRPVAIKFDADGSTWVVELRGYMMDLDGTDEDKPIGRIVVLEDTDADGKADKRTVFLDKILLPRALAIMSDGILYADEHQLYFVERDGLKAGTQTIVDAKYAIGGNVEHKPNHLLQAIDNWIYSAKSAFRYRRIDGEWVKEATDFRGQWGITQDNSGRLFHNSNSTLAVGDYLPPNLLQKNSNIVMKKPSVARSLGSNRIYPIRMNPGVNRAYMTKKNGFREDVIDPKTFKLRTPTAASGLEVYRGDQFPSSYQNQLFITAPCANLISVLALEDDHKKGHINAVNPLSEKDFIASTDERFRPVNLHTAPDGTLYIADFYHGIIQHKTYLTSYLRNQYASRGLDKPGTGSGRIYRIRYTGKPLGEKPNLHTSDTKTLVDTLSHTNGWWRDTAQRLLIEKSDKAAVSPLQTIATNGKRPETRIHALYTLEGLNAISPSLLNTIIESERNESVLATALRLTEVIPADQRTQLSAAIIAASGSRYIAIHKAYALSLIGSDDTDTALIRLLKKTRNKKYLNQAVLSGLVGRESEFKKKIAGSYKDKQFNEWLKKAEANADKADSIPGDHLEETDFAAFTRGKETFGMICASCHGADGAGLPNLGPLLNGSDWVTSDTERLTAILLHGLSGPITINGKPFNGAAVMPGLSFNPAITDEKLADVMTYIRNSWDNKAAPIKPDTVKSLREQYKDRNGRPFTEPELIELLKK